MDIKLGMDMQYCKLCNSLPQRNKYEDDGSFYCTTSAIVFCQKCGVKIEVEAIHDRDLDKGLNGFDAAKTQYYRALLKAATKWNAINK